MTPIAAVLAALLVVWVTPAGEAVLVRHAREAGGLEHVQAVAEDLRDAAAAHGVDADLLAALAVHESGLRHVETRWGVGVLQINPAHRLAAGGLCCAADVPGCMAWHVDAGAAAFAESLAACGDEWGALGHYRAGRCMRRERELLVLRTRLEVLAARCVREDAARWSLTAACAARPELRRQAKGGTHGGGIGP